MQRILVPLIACRTSFLHAQETNHSKGGIRPAWPAAFAIVGHNFINRIHWSKARPGYSPRVFHSGIHQ